MTKFSASQQNMYTSLQFKPLLKCHASMVLLYEPVENGKSRCPNNFWLHCTCMDIIKCHDSDHFKEKLLRLQSERTFNIIMKF